MAKNSTTNWCESLDEALADGRFAEDPGFWDEHLRECPACLEQVEAYTILRHTARSSDDPMCGGHMSPSRGRLAMQAAFLELKQRRRAALIRGGGLVLLLAVAVAGIFFGTRDPAVEEHPSLYAEYLDRQVFPKGLSPRYDLLKSDSGLREQYMRALDNPSALVRRTALGALLWSGIELPVSRLEDVLTRWDETLDGVVEVAAEGGGGRHLIDALERRRTATLAKALMGIRIQVARGGAQVSPVTVLPLLVHRVAEVRAAALGVLALSEGFAPGENVIRCFRLDSDADVRARAAMCLLARGGETGTALVVDWLAEHEDWTVEKLVVTKLASHAQLLELSRARLRDPAVDLEVAMIHLLALSRADAVKTRPARLVERVLASEDRNSHAVLARVAAREDWVDTRSSLQLAWRTATSKPARLGLGHTLVKWDLRSGDADRLRLALEILEQAPPRGSTTALRQLADSDVVDVREKARELLNRAAQR